MAYSQRNWLTAPRARQRVRVAAQVAADVGGMLCNWNHQSADGRYRAWWCAGGNVHFSSSHDAGANWEFSVQVTDEGGGCEEPRGTYDARGVLLLVYTHVEADTPSVKRRVSFDDGKTWSEHEMAFTGGKHPTVSPGADGTVIWAAWIEASGKIQAYRQEPSQTFAEAEAAPFYLKDETGTDLVWEDDSFHLVEGRRSDVPWLLIGRIAGESAPSHWRSSDDGLTWTRE